MAEFFGTINKNAHVVVDDHVEVPMCPNCTFPNTTTAIKCENCNYPLQDVRIRWVKAGLIRRCPNPSCTDFVRVTDKTCKKCGHDVHAAGESSAKAAPAAEESEQIYGKICPACRTKNSAVADNCIACGAELPLLPEALDNGDAKECSCPAVISACFENIRTGCRTYLKVPTDGDLMIGLLGHLSDQFAGADFVSREHFHLIRKLDSIYIKDTSSNGTYINGVRLMKGKEYALASGTVIGLGDPSFDEHLAAFIKISYLTCL